MRRILAIFSSLAFFVCAVAFTHAQVTTGVGHGAPGGGGGGGAIAFVNAADGGNATATTLIFSKTVGLGTGRLLVAGVMGDHTIDDVTGVTYAGSAMTLAAKLDGSATPANRWAYLFWLVAPTSGANNIVVSATSSHFLAAGVAEYTGVNATGQPDGTPVTNAGAPGITSLTTSITTVSNNSWVILLEDSFDGNIPPTAGAGLVRRATDAAFGSWGLFDSNGAITPAGAYSMTTNRTNPVNTINHVAASFRP